MPSKPIKGKPSILWISTLGWFKILMFWSWDLCTSHLICTTLMIISSYSEDFCHLQPLRASHRKFSGTVGDIENRTSLNPPFMGIRMKWSNSTRCDIYRSVRNAIKLTKWQEMLRSQPLWGHFWRILCYEAGHKWTQPTLHCTCCAVCIGRHNCRHYNWLAAASVLGCLQNHKNNTSFSFCSWKQN